MLIWFWFNPIPGGGPFAPPLRLFLCHCQTPQDRKLILGDFFLTLIAHILTTKNTGSGQVSSPEAVCWPHLRKVCNHARARVFHRSISSLQVFIRVPPCTKCISHSLYICDLKSGQTRDLYITTLRENIEMRPALSKRVKTTQLFQNYYDRLCHLRWSRCHLLAGAPEKVIWGHVRSSIVYRQ